MNPWEDIAQINLVAENASERPGPCNNIRLLNWFTGDRGRVKLRALIAKRFGRDCQRVGDVLAIHLLREFEANSYRLPTCSLGHKSSVMPWGEACYIWGRLHEFIFRNKGFKPPSRHSKVGMTPIGDVRTFESTHCQ
jgi:hypothetical protein